MDGITEKHLQNLVDRINVATSSPATPWGPNGANIGNYHISHAYGGVCLHRMYNAGGGVSSPLGQCHESKRALYGKLQAFLAGLENQHDTLPHVDRSARRMARNRRVRH